MRARHETHHIIRAAVENPGPGPGPGWTNEPEALVDLSAGDFSCL